MTRNAIEKEIRKRLEVVPEELERQIGQPKDFDPMMPDKISERDLIKMIDGLETIQRIIGERLELRSNVDFKAIMDEIVQDYKDWINGEKECFADNKIIKAPKFMLKLGTIYGTIPMLIDDLSRGIIRPEFRIPRTKKKWLTVKELAAEAGKKDYQIRYLIEKGAIPKASINREGRFRGPNKGKDNLISREALKFIKK